MIGLTRVLRRSGAKDQGWGTAVAGAVIGLAVMADERRRKAAAALAAPARPGPRDRAAWKRILLATYRRINDDRLLALAAGVVFYALLALFPAITAVVSSYALFAKVSTISDHLSLVAGIMPAGAFGVVEEQVDRIVSRTGGELSFAFVFGLALAIWSANAGVKAVIDALNIVYRVRERRSFIGLNLVSLCFTAGAVVLALLAMAAIVALPVVLSYLPFAAQLHSALVWLRWPTLLMMAWAGLAILYRFGPDRDRPRWRWLSYGSVLAAFAWLGGSALLSWYLGSFADYNATYGSLGAGIGLMMWLWMTAIVVLLGAELNSEIDAEDRGHKAFPPAGPDRIGGL